MKIRSETSAVSGGGGRDHALLAAFLEATGKLDQRALQRRGAISEAPKEPFKEAFEPALPQTFEPASEPVNLEAQPAPIVPKANVAPFAFRRANLVKA